MMQAIDIHQRSQQSTQPFVLYLCKNRPIEVATISETRDASTSSKGSRTNLSSSTYVRSTYIQVSTELGARGANTSVRGSGSISQNQNQVPMPTYSGGNAIGDKGCRYLSKGRWDHLDKLCLRTTTANLDDNRIEAEGCRHLVKGKWDHLSMLFLGTTNWHIQRITAQRQRDANISVWGSGVI